MNYKAYTHVNIVTLIRNYEAHIQKHIIHDTNT